MEKAKHSIQFEAEVDNQGRISFSMPAGELQLKPGEKVTVNIFGGVLSEQLTKLKVTEAEIEEIGKIQLEDRQHVMTFLASQGVMNRNKRFAKRLQQVIV